MKRYTILMLAAAMLMMLTVTTQPANAEEGIETGTDAELILGHPEASSLTEEEDSGGDTGPVGGDCEFK